MTDAIVPRAEYMACNISHHDYYMQAGRHLIADVERVIGRGRIVASTDPHFNDIPLKWWDGFFHLLRGSSHPAALALSKREFLRAARQIIAPRARLSRVHRRARHRWLRSGLELHAQAKDMAARASQ